MAHVHVTEVVPVPSVNRENNEDKKVRGERKRFSERHLAQSFILRSAISKVNKTAGLRASKCPSPMNAAKLKALLEKVATGRVATPEAERILLDALRAQPFEDLGFARVDHHRALRQGFPEVVLGL